MENKASEKGFVDSSQLSLSGFNKIPIEMPDSLCNVADNQIASFSKLEESMVSTGNNHQIHKALVIDHENKLLFINNDNSYRASLFEGSPTKIQVSGNDINLSMDVFGPLDNENNKSLSLDVKNKHVDEEIAGKQEGTLEVGDLVWVYSRTKVWWPGMISDPLDAATIARKRGDFLVRHFGNQRFVWCSSSDVRPFIEHFEQFSTKNYSNIFSGSVQKALCEISQRVKSSMSCSCFEKGNQNHSRENKQENLMSTEKVSMFELRSLPQFDPANFVANVKHLACTGFVPGKIELLVMKDRLSAFYHSVGRCHLPSQLLMPSNDVADNFQDDAVTKSKLKKRNHAVKTGLVFNDKVISCSKVSQSRSRKKSKYLSYPYVDANKGLELNLREDTKKSPHAGKNPGKKGARKHFMVCNTVSKEDNINASPGELLNELRASAVVCPHRVSKYSDSLKRFYCSFRIFSFLDTRISSKLVGTQIEGAETNKECDRGVGVESVKQGLSISERDTAIYMEGNKGEGKKKKQEACSDISPILKPCSSDVSKRKIIPREKKEGRITRELLQDDTITKEPEFSGEPSVNQQGKPLLGNLNGSVVSQNRNGVTVPSTIDVQVTLENFSQLSTGVELNGTSKIQSGGFVLGEPNAHSINIGFASSNVQNPLQMGVELNGTSKIQSGGFVLGEPNAHSINIGLESSHVQNLLQMGGLLHPSSCKTEPKERNTMETMTKVASVIPDLNGNVLSEDNPVSAEGEPQLKRASDETGSSVKRRKVLNNKEDPGAGLLLKFTPDFLPPSKETLIATFSRFGLLKESEIQVIDSSTTQIMYERSSDAKFAFRSLEKSSPFGASLASFNLHRMPAVDPKTTIVKKRKVVKALQQQQPSNKNGRVIKESSPSVGADDVGFIKQNVEMMKSALEKAGDTVSPGMRAKLENVIKSFLDKIGSSSSS